MMLNFTINIPFNLKLIIWKKKNNNFVNLKLFNGNKEFKLYLNKNVIFYDKWCNSLSIKTNKIEQINKINYFMKNFLKSWDMFFYNKIKFKGKGFRIKHFKKLNFIKFFFGRSHKTFLILKKIKKIKINKYKFILVGLNKQNILKISRIINNIKPINIYTLRGLRSARQIIFKRKGKKGTYI